MLVQTPLVEPSLVQASSVQTSLAQTSETRDDASTRSYGADEEAMAGAETILLVEDEAFVREVTCEVLRSAGYRVLTAKNAAEAVSVYEAQRGEVGLLLTDVVLPGETGRALARRLRRESPELQILLVTGYGEQMEFNEAKQEARFEAKWEECLAKPFSSEVLLGRIRRLLDRGTPLIGTSK
jgi:two-component system cell cycle sensor histidine kinase/response regulator CckA